MVPQKRKMGWISGNVCGNIPGVSLIEIAFSVY